MRKKSAHTVIQGELKRRGSNQEDSDIFASNAKGIFRTNPVGAIYKARFGKNSSGEEIQSPGSAINIKGA